MKQYVIDTSVAVKWFIIQPYYENALELLDNFHQKKCILNVPSTIYLEFANVLWKYKKYNKVEELQRIFDDFLKLELVVHDSTLLLKGALDIAVSNNRSVYDSIFIFLARELKADLITNDEKLVNAISKEFDFVKSLKDFKE